MLNCINFSIKTKSALILCALFIAITSCKRETSITGRLMLDCDIPSSYTRLHFMQIRVFPFTGPKVSKGITKTDAEGYFSIDLETRRNANFDMYIGSKKMIGIPASRFDVVLDEVYLRATYKLYIQLSPTEEYTETDTLFYRNNNYQWKKVAGPFHEGQILDSLDQLVYESSSVNASRINGEVFYYINNFEDVEKESYTSEICNKNWIKVILTI